MSEYSKKVLKNLTKDCALIEAEAFHHFKFCSHCIPGAMDMTEETRLCLEGQSYIQRMRKAEKA